MGDRGRTVETLGTTGRPMELGGRRRPLPEQEKQMFQLFEHLTSRLKRHQKMQVQAGSPANRDTSASGMDELEAQFFANDAN